MSRYKHIAIEYLKLYTMGTAAIGGTMGLVTSIGDISLPRVDDDAGSTLNCIVKNTYIMTRGAIVGTLLGPTIPVTLPAFIYLSNDVGKNIKPFN